MIGTSAAECVHCQGSGWIPIEGTLQVRACQCYGDLRKRQRMQAAAIPKRYTHCSLSTFYDRGTISLRNGKNRASEFSNCWPTVDRGLLLMGPCGSGKTHLAVAIFHEIIESGKPGRLLFSNFQDLIQEIQATFGSDANTNKSEILQPLLEADLLILDELGSQKPTSFVQDILYYVINSRYNDEKPTIFTTNYLDDPREREDRLEDRIGNRLRSRLHEMSERVVIESDDYRKTAGRRV